MNTALEIEAAPRAATPEIPQEDGTENQNNRGNFTRNLNKESDAGIAKKMFFGGCFFLPWLWAVNVMHYRAYLRDPKIDPQVTKWVRLETIGFCFYTLLLVSWIVIFQLHWKEWNWQGLLLAVPEEDSNW